MGRNCLLPQSRQLHLLTTGILVSNMQDLSQREIRTPLIRFRREFQTGRIELRSEKMPFESDSKYDVIGNEDAANFDSDLPDVFEDPISSPRDVPVFVSRQVPAEDSGAVEMQRLAKVQPEEVPDVSGKQFVENILSIPNIVVQFASSSSSSSEAALGLCAVKRTSRSKNAGLSDGLLSKKGRTHSDSVIYESDQKKQCLRGSLSSSRSLNSTPSNQLNPRCDSGGRSTADGATKRPPSPLASECASDDRTGSNLTSKSLNPKPQFLKPITGNFDAFDHFTDGRERSPKLFWLRRHSDSNVADQETDADRHSPRSQSTGDAMPEIRRQSGNRKTGREESEDLRRRGVPVEDGRRFQKVKKYLQLRYQNQSLDSDDVFIEATDAGSKQTPMDSSVPDEASKSTRPEIDETLTGPCSNSPIKLQGYSVPETSVPPSVPVNQRASIPPGRLARTDGDYDSEEFQNDDVTPAVPLSPSGRTVFDFSFPAVQSVLREIPDCSEKNVVRGLLPQNCFSSPFLYGPLPSESFSPQRSSPTGMPTHTPISREYYSDVSSRNPVQELDRWGTGSCHDIDCSQRDSKSTVCSSGTFDDPDSDTRGCASTFALCQPSCSNNSADGAACFVRIAGKDVDVPSFSGGTVTLPSPTIVVPSLPSLHALALPSPSSPSVGTLTKSCPQIVFDFQFSEKVNEQRQSGQNAGFVCPVCACVLLSYNSLANHVVTHLPSEVISPDGSDSSKVHLCKVCNRSFSRSDMLSRHMRLHTGLRPYECHLCRQVFSRSDHLHTHLRTHTGEKPYRCSHCTYAAPRRDMVTRHMRIHARGGTRRGRRSSSTSSLASDVGQTSDDNAVFETISGRRSSARRKPSPGGARAISFQKQRNWSLTSAGSNKDGQDLLEDLPRMTRTESTTSIDSGVSHLTPRSLVPSLWSPGIDSPDVFSRFPGHFLWPATGSEIKHDVEKSLASFSSKDTDFEMQTSFQKCQVKSPFEQTVSANSEELSDRRGEEEFV